jgi:hypothetical protein
MDSLLNYVAEHSLSDWVMNKRNDWRDHYETNYAERHDEYYRLWRGYWSKEDSDRDSERSQIISPALQQAVESSVAEIEEATFGKGPLFDIRDDYSDQEGQDVELLKNKLTEDFEAARIRSSIGEALINAAVFGTGIGEIYLDMEKTYTPGSQPILDGQMKEIGVFKGERTMVKLNPVQPRNFLIDPLATTVEDAMGCIIDSHVSLYTIEQGQADGIYDPDAHVDVSPSDHDIDADPTLWHEGEDKVRLIKYFGLVPTEMLVATGATVADKDALYTEAIVILINEGTLLKAVESPYMCRDRPVVAFKWDVVPDRFWGRGVCEKGYMSQKALDTEIRARIDALAYTTHPMMAMDAAAVPRGHQLKVRPGKTILTNGNPNQVLMPFNFGNVDQITFAQANELQKMLQQATGAVDSAGLAGNINGEATAAGISMSLSALIKRQKRTLVNFQENFLIPLIRKAAWRYMQFSPKEYPVADYRFVPISSLGVIQREYEVGQLGQILQSIPPGTPAHSIVLEAMIDHMNVSNREQIIKQLQEQSKPDPKAQQLAQEEKEKQNKILDKQLFVLDSQAAESFARANKYKIESELMPTETALKYSDMNNDGEVDADFERKLKLGDLLLRERETALKEEQAKKQTAADAEAELIRQLTQQSGGPDAEAEAELMRQLTQQAGGQGGI